MFLRMNKLAERAYEPCEQIIRCTGQMDDGQPCTALVPLRLHDKTQCPLCQKVYPAYSSYSRQREVMKAVIDG